jgi:hypothetical protein
MTVLERVTADVAALPDQVAGSGLAGACLLLAERLDGAAARDSAPLARELRAALAELHALAEGPTVKETSRVDELKARRLSGS